MAPHSTNHQLAILSELNLNMKITSQFKYNRNRNCEIIWGLIHRLNLVLKHGIMECQIFKKHTEMTKLLHRYFSTK